jgi:hypothetical protein
MFFMFDEDFLATVGKVVCSIGWIVFAAGGSWLFARTLLPNKPNKPQHVREIVIISTLIALSGFVFWTVPMVCCFWWGVILTSVLLVVRFSS